MSALRNLSQALLIVFVAALLVTCTSDGAQKESRPGSAPFDPEMLNISENGGRKLKGQVLYIPVYSDIPYREKLKYNLSAFVSIHNTDLKNEFTITNACLFDTEGTPVKRFVSSNRTVKPLETAIYYIPKENQRERGAKILLEWTADKQVNEPLIESVIFDVVGNLGRLAFTSNSRIIRELK